MSIENTLERIAASLEVLAGNRQPDLRTPEAPAQPPAPAPTAPAQPTQAPAQPAPAPAQPAPAPAQPAPAPAAPTQPAAAEAPAQSPSMTVEELNSALVQEFHRLGGRERIDEVMSGQFGVTSINDVPTDQRGALLSAVQAITV